MVGVLRIKDSTNQFLHAQLFQEYKVNLLSDVA